jgi:hypothetical protein
VNQSFFYTLPIVDGFQWREHNRAAGYRFMEAIDGNEQEISGGDPVFSNKGKSIAHVYWPCDKGHFDIDLQENKMIIRADKKNWFLDLHAATAAKTAFQKVVNVRAMYSFDGHAYSLKVMKGNMEEPASGGLYRIKPDHGMIVLKLEDEFDHHK